MKNLSIKVIGAIFLLFIVFVAFNSDFDNITGNAVADNQDFLDDLLDCKINVHDYDDDLLGEQIEYLFNITGEDSGDCVLEVSVNDYDDKDFEEVDMVCEIDLDDMEDLFSTLSQFEKYLKDQVKVTTNTDCDGDLKDLIADEYKDYDDEGVLEFFDVGRVDFDIDDGEMIIEDTGDTFEEDEYIWCIVEYTDGGKIDVSFYGPGDKTGSPDKKFVDAGNVENLADLTEDNFEGGICDDTQDNVCGAIYEVDSDNPGSWQCVVDYYSDTLTKTYVSEVFTMVSDPPEFDGVIPNLEVSKEGSYAKAGTNFDMDDYFEDDGDLIYYTEGAEYIFVEVDENGWLDIDNPYDFEGTETIVIVATDGESEVKSNNFTIKVGTGSFIPDLTTSTSGPCVASWTCASWSSCQNGVQTRVCIDQSNCGVDEGKPSVSQVCSDSVAGQAADFLQGKIVNAPVSAVTWVLFFVGLVVFIVGLVVFLVRRKKKKSKEIDETLAGVNPALDEQDVEAARKKLARPIYGKMNITDLEERVKKDVEAGKSPEVIANELVASGQDRSTVERMVLMARAKKIVQDRIKQGFTEEKVREGFVAKGWSKDQIDELFK